MTEGKQPRVEKNPSKFSKCGLEIPVVNLVPKTGDVEIVPGVGAHFTASIEIFPINESGGM